MSTHLNHVVVTGASGDIGAAVVAACLERGAEVLAQYRTRKDRLSDINVRTGNLIPVQLDLTEPGAPRALAESIPLHWTGVDLLVNSVGGARPTRFADITDDEWHACRRLNVDVPFFVLRELLKPLEKAGGSVVNLSSVAALTGGSFGPHYAANKAAVIGLTRSAARSLGPQGIRVNCVAPGPVASAMTESLDPHTLDALVSATALHRIVHPTEVATTILNLATSPAITGQTLVIDGGRFLH
ncbi:MAG TPA: SDR family oxidoreductase [Amycolatopsis sp.]|uniref:SDR family NAD(P)-dependent oxidoreductase n=1 Tax=Amycolatopsis sp. TaxID=37632 RepID=UPI002B465DF8|nr:SDR family oxidoreductase [Amycolatopsis sp.]HKS46126.1 SDR family oxidoreductase [Amycolatopsis sp.]